MVMCTSQVHNPVHIPVQNQGIAVSLAFQGSNISVYILCVLYIVGSSHIKVRLILNSRLI